ENKMVGKSMLNNMGRVTGQREVRPVWNNAKRNFVPTAVLTKSRNVLVITAKQSSSRAVVLNSTARYVNTVASRPTMNGNTAKGNPQYALQDQGIFYSGCSRHMTGTKSYLIDYQDIDGGFVAFAGSPKGAKITRKCKIKTVKLDFEDVYFVKELKFNLFSVSQMCDKKDSVLFTETECLILSPDFKLLDESQVLLKVPRQNNMYSFNLKNVVSSGGLTCLFAKAIIDESNLWHRRLGHVNFKTMNKLVRGNLIRGFPLKLFENDHTCVACQKGKQHKASCKNKLVSSISQPLQMLHMDLFGSTFVKSLNKKMYCLVVTDDFSRTPQQNGVAERKNRTLIEAAMTMLADLLLPATFWAEAINTACYVQNRVLITKPHNKTPYELLIGRSPNQDFMRPFGCSVNILNTLDHLGKFEGKADEGKVEENLHIKFLENKPNVAGSGPEWLFDIDSLTKSMKTAIMYLVGIHQRSLSVSSEERNEMSEFFVICVSDILVCCLILEYAFNVFDEMLLRIHSFVKENNACNSAATLMAQLSPKAKILRDVKWNEEDAAILVRRDVTHFTIHDYLSLSAAAAVVKPIFSIREPSALQDSHLERKMVKDKDVHRRVHRIESARHA
ncbi:putative ribonuclease H-like domain-containing protein, partial [Tanacetum coccineum]